MSKRKPKPEPVDSISTDLLNTSELAPDAANPRRITDQASSGLRNSLKQFGDLSGIVFNQRTGKLVTGHQRMAQIRAQYGEHAIEPIDAAADLYGIRIDAEHFFAVRVVDWSQAKQRAANLSANNQKTQGAFTDEVTAFLLSVEAAIGEELPGVLDDCLLADLLALGGGGPMAIEESAANITETFQVIVQCSDEEHQRQIYEQLSGEGLSCKVLTL